MNNIQRSWWARGKREILQRLGQPAGGEQRRPMLAAANMQYEFATRARGIACGGIGSMHLLARKVGLIDAIDRRLQLLKIQLPYRESDHMLNIAYNLFCGGTCLEDMERRRNDAVFLDALDDAVFAFQTAMDDAISHGSRGCRSIFGGCDQYRFLHTHKGPHDR